MHPCAGFMFLEVSFPKTYLKQVCLPKFDIGHYFGLQDSNVSYATIVLQMGLVLFDLELSFRGQSVCLVF